MNSSESKGSGRPESRIGRILRGNMSGIIARMAVARCMACQSTITRLYVRMGTLQRIDWLAGIKRLNPGAVKGYEPFFHGSSQSQAAHTSSCLNGLDVVVNYNYERVA